MTMVPAVRSKCRRWFVVMMCITVISGLQGEFEDGRWLVMDTNVTCKGTHVYTNDTANRCKGWSNIDLEVCKLYCEDNALPKDCKQVDHVCRYVVWDNETCHLARICVLESRPGVQLFEYQRNGKYLKSQVTKIRSLTIYSSQSDTKLRAFLWGQTRVRH